MIPKEVKAALAFSFIGTLLFLGVYFILKSPSDSKYYGRGATAVAPPYIEADSLKTVIMELRIENGRNEIIIERIRDKDSMIVIEASKNLE